MCYNELNITFKPQAKGNIYEIQQIIPFSRRALFIGNTMRLLHKIRDKYHSRQQPLRRQAHGQRAFGQTRRDLRGIYERLYGGSRVLRSMRNDRKKTYTA